MKQWIQNKNVRIWVPPIAGLLFYGGWAFFINSNYGWLSASKAALTQGSYSFVVTLVLAISVEWLFVHLKLIPGRSCWVFLAAFIILASTSTGLNMLTGTPNILWTILPGLMVSSIYTVIYIATLNNIESKLC